nr:MAG TPA: hypothetical protein [Caudoviricetes sp.]
MNIEIFFICQHSAKFTVLKKYLSLYPTKSKKFDLKRSNFIIYLLFINKIFNIK